MSSSGSNQENPNQNQSEANTNEEPKNIQEQRSIIDPSTELGSKNNIK
jgi:hypothetical protein